MSHYLQSGVKKVSKIERKIPFAPLLLEFLSWGNKRNFFFQLFATFLLHPV
jgi:hypothetical protein